MRIYSVSGDLPFRMFSFKDGQQHIEIQGCPEDPRVVIEARIANAIDLMNVVLAKDALNTFGVYVDLDIRYLLGARMDRRIGLGHPLTLEVVARMLMGCGFRRIRVLDPHSRRSLEVLSATAVMPHAIVRSVLRKYHPESSVLVAPDNGAHERVQLLTSGEGFRVVLGRKHREPATGDLSAFVIEQGSEVAGKHCLIIDDLCDGGRTFIGQADELRKAGATAVDLYVTHGIFSNGIPLDGIDLIHTTDSYTPQSMSSGRLIVHVIDMSDL